MRVHIRLILFFLLCLSLVSCSSLGYDSQEMLAPRKRNVTVLLVLGNGVDRQQTEAAVGAAREEFLAQANIKLSMWDVMAVSLQLEANDPDAFLMAWKGTLDRVVKKNYDLVYLALPHAQLAVSESSQLEGYAEGIGLVGRMKNPLAYGVVTGNLATDTRVVLHEIGHLLGAQHANQGVMTTKELRRASGLVFSDHSVREMHTVRSHSFVSVPQNWGSASHRFHSTSP